MPCRNDEHVCNEAANELPLARDFIWASGCEEMQRLKALSGCSRAVVDLTPEEIARMAATRMAPEHDHLNALLDNK